MSKNDPYNYGGNKDDKGNDVHNTELVEEKVQDGIDQAQENIKKGERTRLIYELLMENLDCTYENTFQEVVTALKAAQNAYNEGVKHIEYLLKAKKKN